MHRAGAAPRFEANPDRLQRRPSAHAQFFIDLVLGGVRPSNRIAGVEALHFVLPCTCASAAAEELDVGLATETTRQEGLEGNGDRGGVFSDSGAFVGDVGRVEEYAPRRRPEN